jgi:single-stranded-DNA-specific exonuclease
MLPVKSCIAVYGDYDVDGVTSTALLTLALRAAGAQVREYIPNRFEEGYGLNKEALDVP